MIKLAFFCQLIDMFFNFWGFKIFYRQTLRLSFYANVLNFLA